MRRSSTIRAAPEIIDRVLRKWSSRSARDISRSRGTGWSDRPAGRPLCRGAETEASGRGAGAMDEAVGEIIAMLAAARGRRCMSA